TTSYLYNAANRLVSLTNLDYLQADYQLDPAGRVLSRVSNSGARTMTQYDANGWVSKLTQYDAANALVSETNYTRDRVGNILTQSNTAGANIGTTTFSYDALYRLSTADYPSTANDELFTYDKVGNRKTATKGSLIANTNTRYYGYFANTNRLAEIRIGSAAGTLDSSFTNDFEGRLTAQTGTGAKTLTWDAKSRLKTITQASITQTYGYDPMDYRIRHSNTTNGQLDYYLEGEHLESVEQNGYLTEKYFRGISTDELIAAYLIDTDGKSKPYQFHHDNVTSTTQVTGHNGGTLQSISYSAFGSTLNQTGSSPNRLKYTGREDDQTGLYYYRARYYDTNTGRFISEDPLGFEAGINFYAYVDNNPVNANDPSGQYGEVTVDGNKVNIVIPIRYSGIGLIQNPAATNQYNQDIASKWSGNIGGLNVTTSVKQLGFFESLFTSNSKQNFIDITSLSRGAPLTASVSCTSGGGCNGQWPASMAGISGVGGHEAGHILRLDDKNTITGWPPSSVPLPGYENNIMGTTNGSPVAGQVYSIIDTSKNGWQRVPSGPDVGKGNFSIGGASGGFLLYPNKPNSNMMQSVYRK
ncbi:MAG: RHS repeat-associated core domain-containing protein, partial [Methylotenera sp.]|nr:RHS repeat-associated core domain-containing protein [Methylotenera sp.]